MPVEKTTQRDVPSMCPSFELTKRKSRISEYLRIASVRAARRKLVKLFRKPNSRFYWYDFTVRGHRYREGFYVRVTNNDPDFLA